MKRLFTVLFVLCAITGQALALEHPIDTAYQACKAKALTPRDVEVCSVKAVWAWNREIDKYYSLLYKKFDGADKTAMFDSQKYWVMYKNNEFKIIDGLTATGVENDDKTDYRFIRKQEIMKERANSLRTYYARTFDEPDTEKKTADEKIPDKTFHSNIRIPDFLHGVFGIFESRL